MPPYNLKQTLSKVHDKPFNFQLIMGKKQVLLVTPKPAAKAQVDEAVATAVKGVREAKGICKRVGEEIIFFTKNAPTGMLKTGMKLAFNTNNCKSVAWDLQQLSPGESEEAHTEVVEQDNEPEEDSDTTSNSEEETTIPSSTPPQRPPPSTPWIGAKRSQSSNQPISSQPPTSPPPPVPNKSPNPPPPRPINPPPGINPNPQPQTKSSRPLPPTPQPKFSSTPPPRPTTPPPGVTPRTTPPPRPTTPPPGVTPKVSGNVPNVDGKAQKEAFEKEYRETVSLYHNGDEEMRKLYTEAGQLAARHDFAKATEVLERLKALVANKEKFAQARARKQTQRHGRLTEVSGAVQRSYFNSGTAKQIGKEDLKAGKQFKAFLEALKVVEEAKGKPNRAGMNQALDELEAAANAYLQHYYSDDLNDKQRKQKESMRKRSICETTLKSISHWRLAEQITNLGGLPWDVQTEQKAAEVYAKLLFEEGDKTATPNESAGVSGSWWLEKTVWGDKPEDIKQKRKFIFKPIDSEPLFEGIPQGGSAPREVLGKAFSDAVLATTGLNLGVSETHLVMVDNNMLPDREGEIDSKKQAQRLGSLQHFAKTDGQIEGELRQVEARTNPNIYREIPTEECHKVALMDLMTLNLDRHSGNVMLSSKTDEQGRKVNSLIPIDHGLILPTREALMFRRITLGSSHNVIEKMPGKNEKLSPEMLQKLDLIDPDAMIRALEASLQTMKAGHPGQNVDGLVGPESFKLQKRAIQFLKRAAKELTVTELFNALSVNLEDIFDPSDDKMEAGFERAIAGAKARGGARRELDGMDRPALDKMADELHALGWNTTSNKRSYSERGWQIWLDRNAVEALKVWKGKIENPAFRKKVEKMIADLGGANQLSFKPEGLSLYALSNKLDEEVKRRREFSPEEGARLDQLARDMGVTKIPTDWKSLNGLRLNIKAYDDANGDALLARKNPNFRTLDINDRMRLFWEARIETAKGKAVLDEFLKNFPSNDGKPNRSMFESLEAWQEYKELGGHDEYFRLGGDGQVEGVEPRLKWLREAKAEEASFESI
ncbi:MAG: hypothetical protein JWQ71_3368 [Pedosphaera sp.]|nr:hypothetical protein [Pedosphaera sp.]